MTSHIEHGLILPPNRQIDRDGPVVKEFRRVRAPKWLERSSSSTGYSPSHCFRYQPV